MPKIKTREAVEKGARTLDRAAVTSDRMRDVLVRSKSSADSMMDDSANSPSEYASDRFQDGMETAIDDGAHGAYDTARGTVRAGKKGYEYYRKKTEPKREKKEAEKAKKQAEAARKKAEAAKQKADAARKQAEESGTKSAKRTAKQAERTAQRAEKTAQQATNRADEAARRVADRAKNAVSRGNRTIKQSTRAQKRTIKTAQKSIKTAQKTIKTTKAAAKTAAKATKTAAKTTEAAVKTAQETAKASVKATKVAIWLGRMAVKAAIAVGKAVVAAVKAAIAGVKALVAAIAAGGWVAVLIIVIICVIALVIGLFFSAFVPQDSNTVPAKTLNQVVLEINTSYHYDINEALGRYTADMGIITGSRVNWYEILAVYAVKLNDDPNNPQEVMSMNEDRELLLREIFSKMNTISASVKEEERTFTVLETDKNGNVVQKEVYKKGKVLYVTISHKTPDEMAAEYGFTDLQKEQLAVLLLPESQSMWDPFLEGVEQWGSTDAAIYP